MGVVDMEVELIVGALGVDGWTLAEHLAETIDDGVLGLEGGIVGVGEHLAAGGRVNHKSAIDVEYLLPAQVIDIVVQLLLVVSLELGEGLENGECGTAAVVGAVEGEHVATESDGAVEEFDVGTAKLTYFVGEHLFEAHHGLGYHLETLAFGSFLRHYFAVFFFENHIICVIVLLR